jgi:hypothetical protein
MHAAVEVRRAAGGIAPRALLGGSFRFEEGPALSLRVAWSGTLAGEGAEGEACEGLLGQSLLKGLPDEFAAAVLRGLNSARELNAPGILSVQQAGYDPVDSSEYAFERAALLLKWVLLANAPQGPSSADLATFLDGWGSS